MCKVAYGVGVESSGRSTLGSSDLDPELAVKLMPQNSEAAKYKFASAPHSSDGDNPTDLNFFGSDLSKFPDRPPIEYCLSPDCAFFEFIRKDGSDEILLCHAVEPGDVRFCFFEFSFHKFYSTLKFDLVEKSSW